MTVVGQYVRVRTPQLIVTINYGWCTVICSKNTKSAETPTSGAQPRTNPGDFVKFCDIVTDCIKLG